MKLHSIDVDALPDYERTVIILADEGRERRERIGGIVSLLLFAVAVSFMFFSSRTPGLAAFVMCVGVLGLSTRSLTRERAAWIRIARRLDDAQAVDPH